MTTTKAQKIAMKKYQQSEKGKTAYRKAINKYQNKTIKPVEYFCPHCQKKFIMKDLKKETPKTMDWEP